MYWYFWKVTVRYGQAGRTNSVEIQYLENTAIIKQNTSDLLLKSSYSETGMGRGHSQSFLASPASVIDN